MKDWKAMARAAGLDIPEDQLERIAPSLDGLEAAFAPMRGSIPDDVEPATFFRALPEEMAPEDAK